MARGNCIIVTSDPKGQFEEGYVKTSQTFYPGMVVLRDASVALKGGKHTYKIYDESGDGNNPTGALWIVLEDGRIGKTTSDSFAAGERCFLYSPRAGEELNLLLLNIAGTADDHALGEKLMIDTGTSKFIITTGSPEQEVAQLLEVVTDPTTDTLAWCQWGCT